METTPDIKNVVAESGLRMYKTDPISFWKMISKATSRLEELVSEMCSDLMLLQNKTVDTSSKVFVNAMQAKSEVSQIVILLSQFPAKESDESLA
ncbi:hypothetical protein [Paenibacillus macerans]|uniref:Uncharacterized protein n=1 Tax=Paenibacillus macerans TaxID=44252 RepID=A0A090YLX1_PAEMA|nr:hypothetical protein [Paenibacillus macerans]KFM93125.1 hypothetical protein DJ90_2979 [Paenibacillus macerans]MCY7561583.1 hypothetical protein [Paenibacillus macerans]MEC0153318.1 hypothetical protein [Paenibacillus macerans]SUA84827.1 Uncharacterised protein [Paenibacillus macerans]